MLKKFIYGSLLTSAIILLSACSSTTTTSSNNNSSPTTNNNAVPANVAAASDNAKLGTAYLQQGDIERAKGKLLAATNEAPNWAPGQDAMAYFYETTGDKQLAEKYYKQAIAIDPKAGAAQNNYGTFLCRAGRYQEADQHFQIALQDTTYLKTAEVYENAGICALQIPDDVKAQAYFEKAVVADPTRANSFLELGQIYFNEKDYPKSQQAFNQYLQLNKDPNAESLWLGIRLARAQNDIVTAGGYSMTLQSRFPNSPEMKQLKAQTKTADTQQGIPDLRIGKISL